MPDELTLKETEQITEVLKKESDSSYLDAIRLCRKYSGWGLKECKQSVDSLVAELQAREPERYSHLAKKKDGCRTTVFLLLIAVCVILFLLITDTASNIMGLFV